MKLWVHNLTLYCRDCGRPVPWRRLVIHRIDPCESCEAFTRWFLFGDKR